MAVGGGGATVYKFPWQHPDSLSISNATAAGAGKPIPFNDCRYVNWLIESVDGSDVTGVVVIECASDQARTGRWTLIDSIDLATLNVLRTTPQYRYGQEAPPGWFVRARIGVAVSAPINVYLNGLLG